MKVDGCKMCAAGKEHKTHRKSEGKHKALKSRMIHDNKEFPKGTDKTLKDDYKKEDIKH